MGGLVNKWNAVRAEVAEEQLLEEEQERPQSIDELELAKKQRLSDWKQHLSSEETSRNMNFQPVAGDWRARVAQGRARKAA